MKINHFIFLIGLIYHFFASLCLATLEEENKDINLDINSSLNSIVKAIQFDFGDSIEFLNEKPENVKSHSSEAKEESPPTPLKGKQLEINTAIPTIKLKVSSYLKKIRECLTYSSATSQSLEGEFLGLEVEAFFSNYRAFYEEEAWWRVQIASHPYFIMLSPQEALQHLFSLRWCLENCNFHSIKDKNAREIILKKIILIVSHIIGGGAFKFNI